MEIYTNMHLPTKPLAHPNRCMEVICAHTHVEVEVCVHTHVEVEVCVHTHVIVCACTFSVSPIVK